MSHRRWMVLGASLALVALLSVAAVGTALADNTGTPTSGTTSRAQKFLDRLASNLGISTEQLQDGLKTTEKQYVDDAVDNNRITAEQGDHLKQKIDESSGLPGLRRLLDRHPLAKVLVERNVADALGMEPRDLRAELTSGKTLSQVITEHGQTVDEVVNTTVAKAQARLDQAVSKNVITQEREQQILDNLKTHLTDLITNQGQSQPAS